MEDEKPLTYKEGHVWFYDDDWGALDDERTRHMLRLASGVEWDGTLLRATHKITVDYTICPFCGGSYHVYRALPNHVELGFCLDCHAELYRVLPDQKVWSVRGKLSGRKKVTNLLQEVRDENV